MLRERERESVCVCVLLLYQLLRVLLLNQLLLNVWWLRKLVVCLVLPKYVLCCMSVLDVSVICGLP
jgi:hypothetical protein